MYANGTLYVRYNEYIVYYILPSQSGSLTQWIMSDKSSHDCEELNFGDGQAYDLPSN
jgi:hypothetical protein